MSLDTDRLFLDAFRQGQRWALARVYSDHVDEVTRFLRLGFTFPSRGATVRFRGVDSAFQLEDWVHDVFMRAFSESARLQYDGLRPYGPYLQRIARNLVIDELKRKEHALRAYVEELPEPTASAEYAAEAPVSAESALQRQQLRAHVRAFVDGLPERERTVYRLRFVEGREQQDVARAAGLSVSKVKTSERRIRLGFEEHLRDLGWLDEPPSIQPGDFHEVNHA